MRFACISIIGLLLFTASGCGEEKSTNAPLPSSSFPNDLGLTWVYAVYDSLSERSYDLTVSVTDTATFAGIPLTIWTYSANGVIDTEYVFVSRDTVKVYSRYSIVWMRPARVYAFPLEVGREWHYRGEGTDDYFMVDQKDSIRTEMRLFNDAFHVRSTNWQPNCMNVTAEWFVSGIGRVWVHNFLGCPLSPVPNTNEIWILKRFDRPD